MKLWIRRPVEEGEIEMDHALPPIIPGTCTRRSMKWATRLTANAEMKYSAVTER